MGIAMQRRRYHPVYISEGGIRHPYLPLLSHHQHHHPNIHLQLSLRQLSSLQSSLASFKQTNLNHSTLQPHPKPPPKCSSPTSSSSSPPSPPPHCRHLSSPREPARASSPTQPRSSTSPTTPPNPSTQPVRPPLPSPNHHPPTVTDCNKTETLTFTLPTPASSLQGPCTLRAIFPQHWEVLDSQLQASSANQPLAVNVYAIDGPAPGALVGTSRFGGSWEEDRTVWINSFACRDEMKFRFELAGEGEVSFATGGEGGLEVTWGC